MDNKERGIGMEPATAEEGPNFSILTEREISNEGLTRQIIDSYEQLFNDEEGKGAQLQRCYEREKMTEVLQDPEYLKILSVSDEGLLMGCCVVATDYKMMADAYANSAAYENKIKSGETIWYVTVLFATEHKTEGSTRKLLEELTRLGIENNVFLGYDHAEYNSDLPRLIEYVVKKYLEEQGGGNFEDVEVGCQTFRGIRASLK